MASELQFAKQFLTTLDGKSSKYQADHIFYPTSASDLRIPYTLPKLPHPPHPSAPAYSSSTSTSSTSTAASTSGTVTLRLSASRNPRLALTLHDVPLTTPVAEVKAAIAAHLAGPVALDRIKILLSKKPIPSARRTLADALAGSVEEAAAADVALGVMIMGGAADPPPDAPADIYYAATGTSAAEAATAAATTTTTTTTTTTSAAAAAATTESTPPTSATRTPGHWQDQLSDPAFWDDLQTFLQQRLHDVDGGTKLRAIIEKAWRAEIVKIDT